MWDRNFFKVEDFKVNRFFILLSGTISSRFSCVFVNVLASNCVRDRRNFWEELCNLKEDFDRPWCLGGDFNEVLFAEERRRCSARSGRMNDFISFVSRMNVVDLPMVGRNFTRCNAEDGFKWSRLDRFLVHPEWLIRFSFKQWGLLRLGSNHCPVVLKEDVRNWGPKPFRYINAWILHPGFMKLVNKVWEGTRVEGWGSFKLKVKLQMVKKALKEWNVEVVGNLECKLKEFEEKVHKYDLLSEHRTLSEEECVKPCFC